MYKVLFVIVLAVAASGRSSAQSSTSSDPLRLPGKNIVCRQMPAPKGDWVGVYKTGFHFEEGEDLVDDRVIEVGFDSLEAPSLLVTTGTEPGTDPPRAFAFTMRFSKNADVGVRMNLDEVSALPDTSTKAASVGSLAPLPPEMVNRGRNLAEWLWTHRCDESNPKPGSR